MVAGCLPAALVPVIHLDAFECEGCGHLTASEALARLPWETEAQAAKAVPSVLKVRHNASLIPQVARLWLKPGDRVLDVTYGRGAFWTEMSARDWPTVDFDAHDLALDGVDFRCLPEADESVDVVVFDPPYVAQGGRASSTEPEFLARYGLMDVPKTTTELRELIAAGIKEASRVLVPGGRLWVKTMDYISSGKYQQGRHHVVQSAMESSLDQVDEFIHHSGTGPQPTRNRDGSPRRQYHSRRAHSFLCVFAKRKGRR